MEKYDEEEVFWHQYEQIDDLLEYNPSSTERKFYRNFIAKTRPLAFVGISLYAIILNIRVQKPDSSELYSFFAYRSGLYTWAAFCGLSFLAMFFIGTKRGLAVLRILNCDSTDILNTLGKSLFFFRLLRFFQAIGYLLLDSSTDKCNEAPICILTTTRFTW